MSKFGVQRDLKLQRGLCQGGSQLINLFMVDTKPSNLEAERPPPLAEGTELQPPAAAGHSRAASADSQPNSAQNSMHEADQMEAMRKRMEKQNEIGGIEIQQSCSKRCTAKIKKLMSDKDLIKGAKFSEHIKTNNNPTEYDIRSLWLLHGNWWIRRKLVWFIEWKPFENFITLVILANSVMLACTDYSDRIYGEDYISIRNLNMAQVDTAFSIIFLWECITKILAMGFILHKNSYMRDRWNWLDIFVVSISVITWLPGIESNSSMKSLRTFRILRPLRSINSLPSMKALIQSLLSSLPGLVNVFIFLAFIFTIFAIFGTHQFEGSQYRRCRMTDAPVLVNATTNEYEWEINFDAEWLCRLDSDCTRMLGSDVPNKCGALIEHGIPLEKDKVWEQDLIMFDFVNFNNVPMSLFTIFQCLTLEGWVLLMYNYMDANSYSISIVYFCFMVIFGSFFAMQLVLAQIMESFADDQLKSRSAITEEEINEEKKIEIAGLFLNATKGKAIENKPSTAELEKAEKDSAVITPEQDDNLVMPEKEPTIANNAEIAKKLSSLKEDEKQEKKNQPDQAAELKIEMSDADFSQVNPDLPQSEWATNKRESFPGASEKQLEVDSDSEFEDETQYEVAARDRSKKNWCYKKVYALVNHPLYNFIVFVLILANTIVLASDDYPQSLKKEAVLSALNDFFTWAFCVEMVLKMIGLGINNYIHDKFNLFDAIVVSLSLVDWSLAQILTVEQKKSVGSSMQALRALRLLRVIKLARSWTKLQDILGKTVRSLKDISNFGVLLFLFMYIFALLGMEMFSNQIRLTWDEEIIKDIPAFVKSEGIMIAPRYNFDNVYNALVVVFCAIMGEDWNNSMYAFIRPQVYNQYMVMGFFLMLLILGNIMLLSLFTAILLQNFEESEEDKQANSAKPKTAFSPKKLLTKKWWVDAKNAVVGIFDTKGKKKQKQEPESLAPNESNNRSSSPDPKKPAGQVEKAIEGTISLPKQLQENPEQKKNAVAVIALLHYELNEAALGVSTGKTMKVENELAPLHGYSLYCFGPHNPFRVACHYISSHKYFGTFIIILIGISTICLALQTPLDAPDSQLTIVLTYIDYVMTGFFICEMFTNIFAKGFVACGKESYIRNAWNVLDFIIVLSATISVIFTTIDLGFIKSLRVMRVLRPLRLLAKHKGLKLAISALFNSLPNIGNLLMIVMFFIFMLAILCCTLFSGQFWYCEVEHLAIDDYMQKNGITNRYECLLYGGEWVNPDFMFDTTMSSMLTLVSTQSTEGWVDTMWYMIDVQGQELQPVRDSKRYYCLFAMGCLIFMTLLFLNLFVGVVIESFNHEKEELSLNKLLKKVEQTWIETLQLCYSARPSISTPKTNQKCRDFMIDVCDNKKFDNFILLCILGNTLSLTLKWYGQTPFFLAQLEIVNLLFGVIFTIEAIMKILAYRRNYFREAWNKFDFTVVILTWVVVIIMSFDLPFDVSILGMIARTLRIGRVFRLVKRVSAIQIILQTLLEAIPAISALGLLLGLLFFLYSIIGLSQFCFVTLAGELNYHVNFQSFANGVLLLMRNATGEAWDTIMFDCMRTRSITFQCDPNADYYTWKNNGEVVNGCGQPLVSVLFYYSFTIIVSQIFLNLFIAIIIDSFMGQSQAYNMPINQADIDDFIETWQTFDPNGNGTLECHNLEKFVCQLSQTKSKLIANKKRILKNVTFRRKFIAQLEIPSHHDFGVFMFVDTLQCMSRLVVEANYIKEEVADQRKFSINHKELNADLGESKVAGAIKDVLDDQGGPRNHKTEFRETINGISQLDKNIASVGELIKTAGKMGKKALGRIDINKHEEEQEIYSSKHYIYGELIVKCWRDFLEVKADEINNAEHLMYKKPEDEDSIRVSNHSRNENSQTELIKMEDAQAAPKKD